MDGLFNRLFVFHIDIETCSDCGGAVKVIACIEDPVGQCQTTTTGFTNAAARPASGSKLTPLDKGGGAILQRKEKGYWHDFLVDGKPVVNPVDEKSLPSGWYRLRVP